MAQGGGWKPLTETGETPGSATRQTIPSLLLHCQLVNCGVYRPSYTDGSHSMEPDVHRSFGAFGAPGDFTEIADTSPRHSLLGPGQLQNALSGTPTPTLLEPPPTDTQSLCP